MEFARRPPPPARKGQPAVTIDISGLLPLALIYGSGTRLCSLDTWAETDSWTGPPGEGQAREADNFWAGPFEGARNCCLQAGAGQAGAECPGSPGLLSRGFQASLLTQGLG